jgi:adenosylcobinamide-GDP ribazoletransferase
MNRLLAAVRFLTILPIPGSRGTLESDLARCVPWFPVVGLLLGVVAAAVAWVLVPHLPPMALAAVLVIVLLSFSGCLHLDGLSDAADGMLSSRPRERMLEIMKDSHTGAMGVVAIACVLLLKFACLASLPRCEVWRAAFLMPVAGRCALVWHMAILPYARSEGLGGIFYRSRPRLAAASSAMVLAAAACVLLGERGIVLWVACVVAVFFLSGYVYRKIGGATGDTLGAVCELVEIVPALAMAAGLMHFTR